MNDLGAWYREQAELLHEREKGVAPMTMLDALNAWYFQIGQKAFTLDHYEKQKGLIERDAPYERSFADRVANAVKKQRSA